MRTSRFPPGGSNRSNANSRSIRQPGSIRRTTSGAWFSDAAPTAISSGSAKSPMSSWRRRTSAALRAPMAFPASTSAWSRSRKPIRSKSRARCATRWQVHQPRHAKRHRACGARGSSGVHRGFDARGDDRAGHFADPGAGRDLRISRQLACHADPRGDHPDLHHCRLRGDVRAGFHHQCRSRCSAWCSPSDWWSTMRSSCSRTSTGASSMASKACSRRSMAAARSVLRSSRRLWCCRRCSCRFPFSRDESEGCSASSASLLPPRFCSRASLRSRSRQ